VRCVELIDPKVVESKDSHKPKSNPAINTKALDLGRFTTNGSELVVGLPPNCEDNSDIRYKYFSLQTGKLTDVSNVKEANYFYNICYDVNNNVVWGLSDNKKTFELLACYRNTTIPEKFSFPDESSFHTPYENLKIIEIASEGLNIS